MSEKIYAWLLHLYPAHFRKAYGEEALQLYRDRVRDERGWVPRLRLWLDLLTDLAVSVPREYRRAEPAMKSALKPALIGAPAQPRTDGLPGFRLLEDQPPRAGALLSAIFLTLAGFAAASVLINYGGSHVNPRLWKSKPQAQRPYQTSANDSAQPSPGEEAVPVPRQQQMASGAASGNTGSLESDDGAAQPSAVPDQNAQARMASAARAKTAQATAQTASATVVSGPAIDAAARHRIVDGAVANLMKYYNDPNIAQKAADALLAHQAKGDDESATDGQAFATLLTRQMLVASNDGQLKMRYYPNGIPQRPAGPSPESLARYREALEKNNCFFQKVEILPHNIGYLKLDSFPDPEICGPKAAAAMASLNNADAIVFDLRDNTGGYPKMVALVAGYLFRQPTHLNDIYNRAENTTEQNWTPQPTARNRLADKPAYVLTSGTTFSGAEEFSYDLKMLKRATIVGEPTSGRGHIPRGRRIDDHFEIRVPDEQAINPISKTGWDGPGVQPDVNVGADHALETALKLATAKLRKK